MVGLALVFATAWYGAIAIAASALRIRGGIYAWATRGWARAMLRAAGCRVRASGLGNLQPDAPQVIVCNHSSWFDIFALASVLPVGFHFVGKEELNRIPFFGRAWLAAGHISLDRSNRERAVASLRAAAERIRQERSAVILFPEGTRSRNGELQPFKRGAFLLASHARVPIVPTVVAGSFAVMPAGSRKVRPGEIEVRFGTPFGAEEIRTTANEELAHQVWERMHEMVEGSAAPLASPAVAPGSTVPLEARGD